MMVLETEQEITIGDTFSRCYQGTFRPGERVRVLTPNGVFLGRVEKVEQGSTLLSKKILVKLEHQLVRVIPQEA